MYTNKEHQKDAEHKLIYPIKFTVLHIIVIPIN